MHEFTLVPSKRTESASYWGVQRMHTQPPAAGFGLRTLFVANGTRLTIFGLLQSLG